MPWVFSFSLFLPGTTTAARTRAGGASTTCTCTAAAAAAGGRRTVVAVVLVVDLWNLTTLRGSVSHSLFSILGSRTVVASCDSIALAAGDRSNQRKGTCHIRLRIWVCVVAHRGDCADRSRCARESSCLKYSLVGMADRSTNLTSTQQPWAGMTFVLVSLCWPLPVRVDE